jgi:hypothetical protein
MRFARYADATLPHKKVEVCSEIGLHDVIVIQAIIASAGGWLRWLPPSAPPF